MLKTETVGLVDQYKFNNRGIREITKQLDSKNIRILSAMWKFGPRNLLEVSRRIGMPFTSVYHRVTKLEVKAHDIAYLIPQVSKLGLVRLDILVAAVRGREREVTEALKAPNLWRSIGLCEGPFTHASVQLVPLRFVGEFRSYIKELANRNLITRFEIICTGDYVSNFPDFEYYDPVASLWRFEWEGWLAALAGGELSEVPSEPDGYATIVDKKDLLIIKELEHDARRSFSDIAPLIDASAQAVKYRYDKLLASGIVKYFQFKVFAFPIEVTAYHEIMLEFNSENDLKKFFNLVPKLFFIAGVAKVLRRNALMVQTFMIESQVPKMLSFFSEMARIGTLKSYSAVRIDWKSRETQTISFELFDEEKGWTVDLDRCLAELSRLQSAEIKSQE